MPDREMSMVERVARALYAQEGFTESSGITWVMYEKMALTAIEAMPTAIEEMISELDAAMRGMPGANMWWTDCGKIKERLNAALKEHEGVK